MDFIKNLKKSFLEITKKISNSLKDVLTNAEEVRNNFKSSFNETLQKMNTNNKDLSFDSTLKKFRFEPKKTPNSIQLELFKLNRR